MNKIFSSLLLIVSVVLIQLPIAVDASAAESDKPERKTQLVGPTVGKKVAKAFEAYSADDIPGALAILLDMIKLMFLVLLPLCMLKWVMKKQKQFNI